MTASPSGGEEHVILLLDAPLMAFGVPQVDEIGRTGQFPGRSQLAGLIGNALGWTHGDTGLLQGLQTRLSIACVLLREGEAVRDYQTVDLGQPFLDGAGWTTRGTPEQREGGSAATGTHIRQRWYRADAVVLVAVGLRPADGEDGQPALAAVARALESPARPLFIGRKNCLPSLPPFAGTVTATDPLAALAEGMRLPPVAARRLEIASPRRGEGALLTEWPARLPVPAPLRAPATPDGYDPDGYDEDVVFDSRDWANQLHGGTRRVRRQRLTGWPPTPAAEGEASP